MIVQSVSFFNEKTLKKETLKIMASRTLRIGHPFVSGDENDSICA